MITDEQLDAGLERVKNDELFIMIHSDLGRITLFRYGGEWIQVDFGTRRASFWCQSVSLDFGAVTFWIGTHVIGRIRAKDLKVPQLKYITVLDFDGKVDCVKLVTTMDEFEEIMAVYHSCGYRKVDEYDTHVFVQRVEVDE